MQIAFKQVRVEIPHPVEIPGGKPLRLEDLLDIHAKCAQDTAFKIIVGQTVLFPAANIVEAVPELVRHPVLAYMRQKAPGILDCSPFKHSPHRDMEDNRVNIFQDTRIQYA
jgi:hypothetical protein